jgi:hypothetical protein
MQFFKLIPAIFILTLFAIVALSGSHTIMMTDGHGNMMPCPFMSGNGSLCQMSIMQHLGAWQSLFVATTPNIALLFFVLTLLLVSFLYKQSERDRLEKIKCSAVESRNIASFFSDPLRLAFSRGILHSKRYDLYFIS